MLSYRIRKSITKASTISKEIFPEIDSFVMMGIKFSLQHMCSCLLPCTTHSRGTVLVCFV